MLKIKISNKHIQTGTNIRENTINGVCSKHLYAYIFQFSVSPNTLSQHKHLTFHFRGSSLWSKHYFVDNDLWNFGLINKTNDTPMWDYLLLVRYINRTRWYRDVLLQRWQLQLCWLPDASSQNAAHLSARYSNCSFLNNITVTAKSVPSEARLLLVYRGNQMSNASVSTWTRFQCY